VYAAPGVGLVDSLGDGVGRAAEGRIELGVTVGLGLGIESNGAREQPDSASSAPAA
jgi:hypothetical protein